MINRRKITLSATWIIFVFCFGTTFTSENQQYQELLKRSIEWDQSPALEIFRKQTKKQRNENGQLNNSLAVVVGNDENKQKAIVDFAQNVTFLAQQNKLFPFCKEFIKFKQEHGTLKEQQLYKDMTISNLVQRLLTKRPLVFCQSSDEFLLRNGKSGDGGFEKKLGTDEEDSENIGLICKHYITYDEMSLAALVGHASKTFFINDGDRKNYMKLGAKDSFEPEGYYAGLVGARFERPDVMEYSHIVITEKQNTKENGYGKDEIENNSLLQLWAKKLYGVNYFPTFDEIQIDDKGNYYYEELGEKKYVHKVLVSRSDSVKYLNIELYKKRMRLVIEPYLNYANEQALKEKKKAYVIVIGLGIGAWALDDFQKQLLLESCKETILQNNFENISDINFSCFSLNNDDYKENSDFLQKYSLYAGKSEIAEEKNINIIISKRNPAARLTENDEGKLLVAMYAWDSNAYSGNEYWSGQLAASGDPAAASCSEIADLQNPEVNQFYEPNIIKWIQDYSKNVKSNETDKENEKDDLKNAVQKKSEEQKELKKQQKNHKSEDDKGKEKENKKLLSIHDDFETIKIITMSPVEKPKEQTNLTFKIVDSKKQESKDQTELSDQTPKEARTPERKISGGDTRTRLASCLKQRSVLGESNPQTKESTTDLKEKTFFTNIKIGLVSVVCVAGFILWLWQNNYFKQLGTPSFAFH